jgi:Fe-S-cluster containining protein
MNTDAPKLTPLHTPDIDDVWTKAAARCGFQVVRGQAAYASTDGRGTILVGAPETLDSDDSLAQLVLHELCHALVQGEASWKLPDWGLDNTSDRDDVGEAACLRLQAELSDRHGLRELMTPTTEWRRYYRALPADPLLSRDPDDQPACARARAALALVERKQLGPVLDGALAATAALLRSGSAPGGLGGTHPLGFALGPEAESCGSCTWRYRGGRGAAVDRCRQSVGEVGDGRRVRPEYPACERWEPPVDCLTCGACCREAYHSVSVSMRDPVVWKQPGLIMREGHRWSLLRAGDRCAALEDGPPPGIENGPPVQLAVASGARAYHCRIYEDRPRTCREFERAGRHCLTARRRVGLSR